MLPIRLPLWIVRRLPTWWRARRVTRMMRRIDVANGIGMERTEAQAAREFVVLVSDHTKKGP